jgi:hypothetical protein
VTINVVRLRTNRLVASAIIASVFLSLHPWNCKRPAERLGDFLDKAKTGGFELSGIHDSGRGHQTLILAPGRWRTIAGLELTLDASKERRAVSARKNAEEILNYLLYQLRDKLQPIGHLDIIEDVQKKIETYYKNLGFSQQDPTALNNWATQISSPLNRWCRLLNNSEISSPKNYSVNTKV